MPRRTKSRYVSGGGAFSLMEVMIALGIFVIGMVAIASIFPVAAVIQRETVREVVAGQVAGNATSLLEQQGIPKLDIGKWYVVPPGLFFNFFPGGNAAFDTDGQIYPFDMEMLRTPTGANTSNVFPRRWPPALRGYPASVTTIEDRTYFWVPLVRDGNRLPNINGDEAFQFEVFVFVLRRHGDATYDKPANDSFGPITWANPNDPTYVPGVRRVAVRLWASETSWFEFVDVGFNINEDQVVIGAPVLDNFGRVYVVREIDKDDSDRYRFKTDHDMILPDPNGGGDPSWVWYAPVGSAGRSSPALLVEGPLSGVVR